MIGKNLKKTRRSRYEEGREIEREREGRETERKTDREGER